MENPSVARARLYRRALTRIFSAPLKSRDDLASRGASSQQPAQILKVPVARKSGGRTAGLTGEVQLS